MCVFVCVCAYKRVRCPRRRYTSLRLDLSNLPPALTALELEEATLSPPAPPCGLGSDVRGKEGEERARLLSVRLHRCSMADGASLLRLLSRSTRRLRLSGGVWCSPGPGGAVQCSLPEVAAACPRREELAVTLPSPEGAGGLPRPALSALPSVTRDADLEQGVDALAATLRALSLALDGGVTAAGITALTRLRNLQTLDLTIGEASIAARLPAASSTL